MDILCKEYEFYVNLSLYSLPGNIEKVGHYTISGTWDNTLNGCVVQHKDGQVVTIDNACHFRLTAKITIYNVSYFLYQL